MTQKSVWLGARAKDEPKSSAADSTPRVHHDHAEDGPPAVLWSVSVDSVEALLVNPILGSRVKSGLVFVQNKRPMADLLVHLASEILSSEVNFRWTHESAGSAEETVDRLCLKRASRALSKSSVDIIECDMVPTSIPTALPRLATAPGLRRGVWVRGHLRDFHPAHLRLFDTMFLFDMSGDDAETLRSAISLPQDRIDDLRKKISDEHPPESVLVFMAGTDRVTRSRQPVVAGNPVLLRLHKDGQPLSKQERIRRADRL
jgi:hypothetical protein